MQKSFKALMDKLGIQQRISTYKLIDFLKWEDHYCRCCYEILAPTPLDKVQAVLDLWSLYVEFPKLLSVVIELLVRFDRDLIEELLTEFSKEETNNIIDIVRFLSLHELDLLARIHTYVAVMR